MKSSAFTPYLAHQRDSAAAVTKCSHCGGFTHIGTAGSGREAFRAHLLKAHPEMADATVQRLLGCVAEMKAPTALVAPPIE